MGIFSWRTDAKAKAKAKQGEGQAESAILPLLLNQFVPGSAVYSQDQPKRLAANSFRVNPFVYTAITTISDAVSEIPMVLYRAKSAGKAKRLMSNFGSKAKAENFPALVRAIFEAKAKGEMVEVEDSHPFHLLVKNPNPWQDWQTLMRDFCADYCLAGNAYLEIAGTRLPSALYAWAPDRVEAIPGNENGTYIGKYKYTLNGNFRDVSASDVIHWKTYNPLSDFYGQSPLIAAAMASDLIVAGQKWQVATLQNSARPSGALIVENSPDAVGSEAKMAKVLTQIKKWMGVNNAGKPITLEAPAGGKVTWQQMGYTAVEMDWLKGLRFSADQIAMVYKIPPIILGNSDASTYSNMEQAQKALYHRAIFPTAYRLAAILQRRLISRYADDLVLLPNFDGIAATAEDQKALIDWASKFFASGGCTQNEYRQVVGYEASQAPEGQMYAYQIPGLAKAAQSAEAAVKGTCTHPKAPGPFDRY